MLKKLVEHLIKALVQNPDKVVITEQHDDKKTILLVSVDEADKGKVIGKDGKTIKALRSLVISTAPKDYQVTLNIK